MLENKKRIFYIKENKKTYKLVLESIRVPYLSFICSKENCVLHGICKGIDDKRFFAEITDTEEKITWYKGILCGKESHFTILHEKKEITEGNNLRKIIYHDTITVDQVVESFCKSFCPLRQNNLECKSSPECPFREFIDKNVEIFRLEEHDKR